MPTQEAIEALLKLRKEQQQNSTDPFTFTSNRLGQRPVRSITGETEQETEDRIEKDKVSLFQAVGAGLYEFGESASFGLLGFAEIGAEKALGEELDFQESIRKYQEDSSLAAILGGVGTGAGYLLGAPMKLTGKLLQKPATAIIAKATKGQTIGKASAQINKAAVKSGIEQKVANEFSDIVVGSTISATAKNKLANEAFQSSTSGFMANINKGVARKLSNKTITKQQADAITEMAEQVATRGIPLQNISQFARTKYGNTRFGRFATEALHDAFVFSVADAVMDASFQSQQMLKGDQEEFNLGQVGYSMATGLLAGTAINASTSFFKPLGKMLKSRKDFGQGLRAYLMSRSMYKDASVGEVVNSMVDVAKNNKKNTFSTSFKYTVDGKTKTKDLLLSENLSHKANVNKITSELIDELGEKEAKTKSLNWLMAQKKIYAKEMMGEATREGLQNYRLIFPRMLVAGAAMGGTQAIQGYATGNELRTEDYISSMLIGAWTQRRGNFARDVDLGNRVQELRSTLEFMGVKTEHTAFGSTFSKNSNVFGVGLARDNQRLADYLKEERLVSDEDESIQGEKLAEDERVFYEDVNGNPIDPHGGRMDYVYELIEQDFQYTKPKDQISDTQANEIINILEKQGLKTLDDFDKAYDDRVGKSTESMESTILGVLKNVETSNFDEMNITTDKDTKKISVPNVIDVDDSLYDRARDGEFKEWLSNKDGEKAVEELKESLRSLNAVIMTTEGLNQSRFNNETNTIKTSETLKGLYNIVRDSEKAIHNVVNPKDNRAEFKFTDVHSYLMPLIQNRGKRFTKNLMSNLEKDNMSDGLKNVLYETGILQKSEDGEFRLIDDVYKIKVDEEYKTKFDDLTKLQNILVSLGDFKLTKKSTGRNVETGSIKKLKGALRDVGIDLDEFNNPKMKFLYQMVLNDISTKRLNNSIASTADIDFIIQQSGNALFSEPGLITDGGFRGFTLKKVDIPHNRDFQNEYNGKLEKLKKESGVVNILEDKVVVLNKIQSNQLESMFDIVYNAPTVGENVGFRELYATLTNSKLDRVKDRLISYMQTFGRKGEIEMLSLLKRQGIINRNADGTLEVDNKFTLEKIKNEIGEPKTEEELQKFIGEQNKLKEELIKAIQPVKDALDGKGIDNEYIEKEIKTRQELNRRYVSQAKDEDRNPSLGLDEFFRKYKFKVEIIDGGADYNDYSNQPSEWKNEFFKDQRYLLDDLGNLSPDSITKIQNDIVKDNKEFKNLDADDKEVVLQDITQVVRGIIRKNTVKKVSIINGKIVTDDIGSKEVMQKNPVFDYLDSLGMDYAIFDNNVTYTEFGRFITEKTYNILSTEGLGDKEKIHVQGLREDVKNQLSQNLVSKNISALSRSDVAVSDGSSKHGMLKMDIYDGMDSIVIDKAGMQNIAQDFLRFYKKHIKSITESSTKSQMNRLKKAFESTKDEFDYKDADIESATRFLISEVAFKSDKNDLFYKILNETNPMEVDKYIKRMKLATTKNFIRSDKTFHQSIINARNELGLNKDITQMLQDRITKYNSKYRVAVWDDEGTESMRTVIDDTINEFKDQYPEITKASTKSIVEQAHQKVSAFDSISFLSKEAMIEMHTIMGHDPDSRNPIKPVISSQGEGKTLLYGKTLFIHSPALDGFFKKNRVDILLTGSGAKAYDGGKETLIEGVRWDELSKYEISKKYQPSDIIRKIDLDAIGLKPEKDASLLSASESDADYNYMDRSEHERAFQELNAELSYNLEQMANIMGDPYRMRTFMLEQLNKGNIPEDAEDGALKNLSNMIYYLQLNESANPMDYSSAQVQKYLSKVYIDNVFSNRRSLVNNTYKDVPSEALRYGGQAAIVQTGTANLGKGKKTRLLPTFFNADNKMILRGQIMLPDKERKTTLAGLGNKKIRIVSNEKILTLEEFKNELVEKLNDDSDDFKEQIYDIQNLTIESAHNVIQDLASQADTRYELGIVSRRNPRTRPNDITLLGLKGFLHKDTGLAVEVNSFDVANIYEGDYDADKVDYFFSHSDYMFDYIKRSQAHFVQQIDPDGLQMKPDFTFGMESSLASQSIVSKMGNAIAYKKGIGIVQKTHRKLNYLQNLTNREHLLNVKDNDLKNVEKAWKNIVRKNANGDLVGPGVLYETPDGEIITMDSESLSFFQRAALEVQYIVDGSDKLNPNIANSIYEWTNNFLFPDAEKSMSASQADAKTLEEILARGRDADNKRIRIFDKYKKNDDGEYELVKSGVNEADKLIIKEFLNQQNKLLASFGDQKYEGGQSRKTSFYDMAVGSKVFKDFHKDIYESLNQHLFKGSWKAKDLDKADRDYLNKILNAKNDSFKLTKKNISNIFKGEGGNYLDRIAVKIADSNFLDNKKEYHLTTSKHQVMDTWFNKLLSIEPNEIKEVDGKLVADVDAMPEKELEAFTNKLDELSGGIVGQTKKFNSVIATIKRLDKNKKYIRRSHYPDGWKRKKVKSIDWVINKLQNDLQEKYDVPKNKLHPKDLAYKKYVSIESNSDLRSSVIHANSMHAFLRSQNAMMYDSWYDTLGDEARKDMKTLTDFNRLEYGKGTVIDEVLAYKENQIVIDSKMIDFINDYRPNISNVMELRNQYLLKMVEKHKLNFLYAYMEPRKNKDDIGVFNNRPIAIPYKETARYKQGIQLLTGLAKGNDKFEKNQSNIEESRKASEFALKTILEGNEHYRRFFDKDVSLMDLTNSNMEIFGLMPFDKKTRQRLNQDGSDFNWTSTMLPHNPMSTINKSVISMYTDYASMMSGKNKEKYKDFLERLNDIEEFSSRKDYLNPIKYMHLRMSLDQDFMDMITKDIYNIAGDDSTPENIKNNPMYAHMKYLKYEPKQVKSRSKVINMLKSVTEANNVLNTAARQNPMKDSGFEVFNTMGEYLKCK